ncbi:MAG: transcription termination/antitermination protein NusG [Deltaproteobacteria bacterium]|nr:transcription termination/antitermination protein NusG [Deltaproteobacteria bacterium]
MSEKKWYVVHTYSGYENKAKKSLEERIVAEGLEEHFEEVLIPMENVVEMVRGERRTSRRKFFPGYMLVKMELNDRTWHCVKNTPRVTGFVGNAKQPPPVPEFEVRRIIGQISEGEEAPKPKRLYDVGDRVRVVDGPFSGFEGSVEDVRADKGKLKVLLSMFGRDTPVELDFIQVEKAS